MITTNFCTRVEVDSVMTCAQYAVDISVKGSLVGSGGSTKLGVSLYFVVGPYN